MTFGYYDKNNNVKRFHIEVGSEWSLYKENEEDSLLNSVFDAVDQNSNGKVDKKELDIFNKLLKIADFQINKSKNNNIIEQEELELLVNIIEENNLINIEGNRIPELITPEIIDIPADKNKFKNYTYLSIDYDENGKKYIVEEAVDYSVINNLEDGKYQIDYWDERFQNGIKIKSPVLVKIEKSNQDGTTNWSEGIKRNISKIQLYKNIKPELIEYLKIVGEEQGFSVEILDNHQRWIEDLSVVRADKKQLIPNCDTDFLNRICKEGNKIIAKRSHITFNKQGHSAQSTSGKGPNAIRYSHVVSKEDIIEGKTYLEGGNVLNTITKNGEPGAVIGEESLQYTMLALNLEDSTKSRTIAKQQISEELGIKEENITYIPQFDFHIDMHYRPLNDGQIAVPDYESGINILKNFIEDFEKKINTENIKPVEKNILQLKKQEYQNLIDRLEETKNKTEEFSKNAEKELKKQGYEIVKIPCFSEIDNRTAEQKTENPINYVNGICGTSAKTGDKYFITNTSGNKMLDEYMENFFKGTVGFDKVYFAPTKYYLGKNGGIDCLTKEF